MGNVVSSDAENIVGGHGFSFEKVFKLHQFKYNTLKLNKCVTIAVGLTTIHECVIMANDANLDETLQSYINYCVTQITKTNRFNGYDALAYYGPIDMSAIEFFRQIIELIAKQNNEKKIVIILHTGGGSVETVEKFVEITRNFYNHVDFLIPEYAMSAGTIWSMSGDNIIMNYASSLGPIDPQVKNNNGQWIPALGYLDKFNELIEKSANDTLTRAEMMMLSNLDLAELQRYKQAAQLSEDLLKKWLVSYKFKNWTKHQTTPDLKGKKVTKAQKQRRAEEIAKCLNDTNTWRSHSRFIGIKTLQEQLRLKIEDYSNNTEVMDKVGTVHKLILQFQQKTNAPISIFWSISS